MSNMTMTELKKAFPNASTAFLLANQRAATTPATAPKPVAAVQTRPNAVKDAGDGAFVLYLPIRTVSESNTREHWAVKAKRVKGQRVIVGAMMPQHCWKLLDPKKHLAVTLCRFTKDRRGWLDDDNLARSFKAIRDQVAAQIGRDDGDETLHFIYTQKVEGRYAVEISVADWEESK